MLSASTQAALDHLKRIKPLDGWSVEAKSSSLTSSVLGVTQVRLLRRNVPLTDNYFLDIHYDTASKKVVGILTPARDGMAQSQVLVDPNGSPIGRKIDLLRVSTWPVADRGGKTTAPPASRSTTNTSTAADSSPSLPASTQELNKQILQYGACAFGALLAARALFSALIGLYILALPLLYLYMVKTCPDEASFEAKKEIKRVLRGTHLPESHPDKPKGFLGETLARINASVTTELATGLGYEVTMISVAGAAWISKVKVPAVNLELYWVGAFDRWFYITSTKLETSVPKRD